MDIYKVDVSNRVTCHPNSEATPRPSTGLSCVDTTPWMPIHPRNTNTLTVTLRRRHTTRLCNMNVAQAYNNVLV